MFSFQWSDSIFLVTVLLCLLYYYVTSTYSYWRKRQVPFLKPIPFFGSSLPIIFSLRTAHEQQEEVYKKYKRDKYVGRFVLMRPDLYVLDPDLTYRFMVEDFHSFRHRGFKADGKADPLSQHLVNTDGPKWKSLRAKLSPVFTSGKLKSMHHQLIDCGESLKEFLASKAGPEGFEAREVMAGFATDVIGRCAFGIKMNALADPNSQFRRISRAISNPSPKSRAKFILRSSFPGLLKVLNWKTVPDKMEGFFVGVIKEAMKAREDNNIQIHDFLQLLIDVKKEDDERLKKNPNIDTDNEVLFDEVVIAANAFVFFSAGFETVSLTVCFCLFELCHNQLVQNRLRDEIRSVLKKYNGVPTFEAVKEMTYLDQVLAETLRKYPPAVSLIREVSNEYTIKETGLTLEKGTLIHFPVYSLHHDAEFFPDPERFDPERFSQENKANIRKGTYLPFGEGPRMCIGQRFAQLEMKTALAILLNEYKFTANPKSPYPLQFNPKAVLLAPLNGFWMNLEKIS